ncbi:hypothetical protein Glove_19g167 [Diversispora epigaea]|uniref:Uncharacterized protein n=1 Tax=Diversispora epigaea TaxID=1348612 RepID=A0A397JWZ3_9GLOM|nr:hypothetical protein Glove_19g167 [Diversispora epigaea]
MSSSLNFFKNFSSAHESNKRKEREERKLRLKEARKLKAREVNGEWRWRCWKEDYEYYLEHNFNYRDFDEIMKLPFLEDRIFHWSNEQKSESY